MGERERGSIRYHRGGWELRWWEGGRRRTKRFAGKDDRKGRAAATRALEVLLDNVDRGSSGLTVAALVDEYIASEGHTWAPSTRQKAPGLAASVAATSLGPMLVADLRQRDVKTAWAEVRALGRKGGTVRRYQSLLSGALSYAVAQEVVPANVALGIRLGQDRRANIDDLPPIEVVYPAVQRIELDRLRSLALVALGTGARRGELAALRWTDFDLPAKRLRISAAISAGERSGTKAGPGRTITIDDATVKVVKDWRAVAVRNGLALRHGLGDRDPVWTAADDPTALWEPAAMSNCWGAWRDRVGIGEVRFHDLRHVHATALLLAGVPVSIVSHRLGHATPRITYEVYSHVTTGDDAVAADVIGRAASGG